LCKETTISEFYDIVPEGANFVIRLKVGPNFCDGEGKPVTLSVSKGEPRILNKVFYKGKVFVNVISVWHKGFSEPMWIMTNLKVQDWSIFTQLILPVRTIV
jgi:hypothetical protein